MRKHIFSLVLAGMLVLTPTTIAFASETTAQQELSDDAASNTSEESEDLDDADGSESASEARSFIPDDERFKSDAERRAEMSADNETYEQPEPGELWGGYSSYQEYLEATKVEELTEEQAAAGYSINEYGHLEEPTEGDAYSEIIMGGVNPGKNTGYVTVTLDTTADIHEEVYVHFMHMGTFKIYGCLLYEINGYQTQICLPTGSYTVHEAGLTLDTVGRFYTYPRQFVVERASTQIIPVSLIDSLEPVDAAETEASIEAPAETVEPVPTPEPVVVTDEPTEPTEKFHTVEFIITLVILVGILIGLFVWVKKHSMQTQSRGFDE